MRKLWSKLLELLARGLPLKRQNLSRSDHHRAGFMNYRLSRDSRRIRIPRYNLCAPLKYFWPSIGYEMHPKGRLKVEYPFPRME